MNAPVSLPKALWRGFTMKCPNCGQGHLFDRFLKVVDSCEVCGEDYTPQRADDLPAYLVIAVVGHLVVPALLAVEMAYSPAVWLQLLIWVPVTGLAAFFLLQPVKGAIVGLQWQTGAAGMEKPAMVSRPCLTSSPRSWCHERRSEFAAPLSADRSHGAARALGGLQAVGLLL